VLKNQPRYILPEKCTACGDCQRACPAQAVNEFNLGLDRRGATYITYPQAVPRAYVIDRSSCLGCGLCEKVCLAGAVKYDDQPRLREVTVGAVILAPGFTIFDPSHLSAYHYGKSPNILTSLEFERILSPSGPYKGHIMRPLDRREPRKIAWLHCVGMRSDREGAYPYCSNFCCMAALKQAIIAREHVGPELDMALFYMDLRTPRKDFEKYCVRIKDQGARLIRSRVHGVEPLPDSGDLRIHYVDEAGEPKEEIFDLVVLSVGGVTSTDTINLAKKLGVRLSHNKFMDTQCFAPVTTSRPGVFSCGFFNGPKDISRR